MFCYLKSPLPPLASNPRENERVGGEKFKAGKLTLQLGQIADFLYLYKYKKHLYRTAADSV